MAKKVRVHLTRTQREEIRKEFPKASPKAGAGQPTGPADLDDSAAPINSTEVSGSGSDLTGSGSTRPTAGVRLF